jgi:hypothetical protein
MDWNPQPIDMTADFASAWLVKNTYNIMGGWRLQIEWEDYATSDVAGTLQIFGSIAGDDDRQVLIYTVTIDSASNEADNLYIKITNEYSKLKYVYTANDSTAGTLSLVIRKVG